MELLHYWSIIRKKLWMITLLTIVCCTAVGYYTYNVNPQYAASTDLIVNQKANIGDLKSLVPNIDAGSITSNILLIRTYKEIIGTPRIMSKVVEQYPQLNATAGELIAEVSVSSVNETQVMSISARDNSYERAVLITNAVSKVFQQEVRKLMNVDNVTVLNWADPSAQHQPVSPNPTMNIMVTFILALMAGIAVAFVLDQLDDTVKSDKDLQVQLGLPLFAAIPKMKKSDLTARGDHLQMSNPAGRNKNVTLDT